MSGAIVAHHRKLYRYAWGAGNGSAGSINTATVDTSEYAGPLAFAFSYVGYTGTIQPFVSLNGTTFFKTNLTDLWAGTTGSGTAIICANLTGGTVFITTYELPWQSAHVIMTGSGGSATLDLVAAVI